MRNHTIWKRKKKKSKFIIKFIIQYTNEKYDIAGGRRIERVIEIQRREKKIELMKLMKRGRKRPMNIHTLL